MQHENSPNYPQETQEEEGNAGSALIELRGGIEANDDSISINPDYAGRILLEQLKKPIEDLGFQLKPVYYNEPNKDNPIDPTRYNIHNNLGEYLIHVYAQKVFRNITYFVSGATKHNVEEQEFPTGAFCCVSRRDSPEDKLIHEAAFKAAQAAAANAKSVNEAIQREKREKEVQPGE